MDESRNIREQNEILDWITFMEKEPYSLIYSKQSENKFSLGRTKDVHYNLKSMRSLQV